MVRSTHRRSTRGQPRRPFGPDVAAASIRRFLMLFSISTLALTGGCGLTDSGKDDGHARELARTQLLWADAGLTDYRYRVRQLCFCPLGGQVVEVEVRRSEVVAGILVQSGDSIPAELLRWGAPSVEGLFSQLSNILENGPAQYEATYDPVLGCPLSASTDPIENAIDDEWGFETSDLEALPPLS